LIFLNVKTKVADQKTVKVFPSAKKLWPFGWRTKATKFETDDCKHIGYKKYINA